MKSIWEFDKSLGFQFDSFWQLLSKLIKVGDAETAPKENPIFLSTFLLFIIKYSFF
tara:strand:+ start:13 stop:180 length:168 start_codon:yes stop_codon:yes gene_type:complete